MEREGEGGKGREEERMKGLAPKENTTSAPIPAVVGLLLFLHV